MTRCICGYEPGSTLQSGLGEDEAGSMKDLLLRTCEKKKELLLR
jgi:hypothetical protein